MDAATHALQVYNLLRAFSAALKSRIADINQSSLASGPDALAGRVISQIFEDGIGVIGHFAGQIEANLVALGVDVASAQPTSVPASAPAVASERPSQAAEPVLSQPSIEELRGAKLLEIENWRTVLLGAYTGDEIALWRAYPARVYGAGNGSLPPLTEIEQAEFARLSRIDQIEGYAAQLRDRVGRADTEAELAQITIADGWP